jgi:hypothetical protein
MVQKYANEASKIEIGALYRRNVGGSMTEVAEVLDVSKDRLGIPHVCYTARMVRGTHAESASETRTLAMESFFQRYSERVPKA